MARHRRIMTRYASYWRYSNPQRHLESCSTGYDPHCIGVDSIALLAFYKERGLVRSPLTIADIEAVRITILKSVGDRELVKVKAHISVWKRLQQALKEFGS